MIARPCLSGRRPGRHAGRNQNEGSTVGMYDALPLGNIDDIGSTRRRTARFRLIDTPVSAEVGACAVCLDVAPEWDRSRVRRRHCIAMDYFPVSTSSSHAEAMRPILGGHPRSA